MNTKTISIIEKVLEKEFYLKKGEHGCYEDEIYIEYNDKIEKDEIIEVIENKYPQDRLDELMLEWYGDPENDMIQNYLEKVTSSLDEEDIEYDEDDIEDYLRDNVYINYPYEYHEKQRVTANLIIDTGDGSKDFTLMVVMTWMKILNLMIIVVFCGLLYNKDIQKRN